MNTHNTLFVGMFLLSLLMPAPLLAFYAGAKQESSVQQPPTRLIVKLRSDISMKATKGNGGTVATGVSDVDQLSRSYNVIRQSILFGQRSTAHSDRRFRNILVIEVDESTDILQMKRKFEKLESVEYAVPDYNVELYDYPDDPLYPHQWALNNTGLDYHCVFRIPGDSNDILVMCSGTPDADIDWQEVYENSPDRADAVIVAIIDTGVDIDHPDLAPHIWHNPGEIPGNGVDDDHNGYIDDISGWDMTGDDISGIPDNDPTDIHGHGTHCAGIVTATAGNAEGVAGVMGHTGSCKIMALKFFSGLSMPASAATEAIVYAADNGADVISMSWGLPGHVQPWEDALDYAKAKGVILCSGAGNDFEERINFPAGYESTIAVSATDSYDSLTEFSTYGSNIDVAAPGLHILSLRADSTDMYAKFAADHEPTVHIVEDTYYLASGTSMSCPYVAGIAAYIRSASPGLLPDSAKHVITCTADDLYDAGWDKYTGWGRVNLNSALAMAPDLRAVIHTPIPNQIVSGQEGVFGSADGAGFTEYVLEYGDGSNPSSWTQIANSNAQVTDGLLGNWDTFGLNGHYSLRLRVGHSHAYHVTVFVANETLAEISIPVAGDTVRNFVDLYGTASCPDFDSCVIEYVNETLPQIWHPALTGTVPVFDDFLGRWLIYDIPSGTYCLKLSVFGNGIPIDFDSVSVYVQSVWDHGWTAQIGDSSSFVANYGDFNNDGVNEIIVGTSHGVRFYDIQGNEITDGMPVFPAGDFRVPIAVGNLDGDNADDIVAISADPAKLYGFPSAAAPFVVDLPERPAVDVLKPAGWETIFPTAFLKDINIDGKDEIHYIPGGDSEAYYIFKPDGSHWGCRFRIYDGAQMYMTADLNGDLSDEIYCIHDDGLVKQLDTCGTLLNMCNIGIKNLTGVCAVDVDSDGDLELVVCGADAQGDNDIVYALDENLQTVAGWPHDTGVNDFRAFRMPSFGDIDADGTLEYVGVSNSFSHGYVHAWHIDGTPYADNNPPDGYLASTFEPGYFWLSPALGDVDNDGHADIVSFVDADAWYVSGFRRITAWNSEGELLEGWPVVSEASCNIFQLHEMSAPAVGDIDQDGYVDLLWASLRGDLAFINLPGMQYDRLNCPAPFWRYNRRMNGIAQYEIGYPLAMNVNYGPTAAGDTVRTLFPEIFWTFYDVTPAQQSVFEIEIGTDAEWSVAEMWSPGPVQSSDTSVVYAGLPLSDETRYYLRIRVGTDGKSRWGCWMYSAFTTSDIGYPIPVDINFGPTATGDTVRALVPEIFWNYCDTVATEQSAYEVQVGTDDDWEFAEMWNSGAVHKGDTSAVYGGFPLSDYNSYHMRIRVRSRPKCKWGKWQSKSFTVFASGCWVGRCTENAGIDTTWRISSNEYYEERTGNIPDGEGGEESIWFLMNVRGEHHTGNMVQFYSYGMIVSYDPASCDTGRTIEFSQSQFVSYVGLAINDNDGTFWYGQPEMSFIDRKTRLREIDASGNGVRSYKTYPYIQGLAYDADNDHLWAIIKGNPDKLVEYDVSIETIRVIQGPFPVPWYLPVAKNAAGLDYDEDQNMLVAVGDSGRFIEYFRDLEPDYDGPPGADQPGVELFDVCLADVTASPRGLAHIRGTSSVYVTGSRPGHLFPLDIYEWLYAPMCGDADGDGVVDVDDVVYLIVYLYWDGPAPDPFETGDVNCDGRIKLVDIVIIIMYIFGFIPEPCVGCP